LKTGRNEPGHPERGFRYIKNLGPEINSEGRDHEPSISDDGLSLYFRSAGQGYRATREKKGELFGNRLPINLRGTISPDELTLYWAEDLRDSDNHDIWVSTRERINDRAGRPVRFDNFLSLGAPVNTELSEYSPCVTAEWPARGSSLYFMRATDKWVTKIYRAAWHPAADTTSIDVDD